MSLLSEQASRILKIPGWRAYRFECIAGGGMLLRGAVCDETFKRGPRKGCTNWGKRDRSTERQLALSASEMAEFERAWEIETGKCHECMGSGQVFLRWSQSEGRMTHDCHRCLGSGVRLGRRAEVGAP